MQQAQVPLCRAGLLAVSPSTVNVTCDALLAAYQAAPRTFVVVLSKCPSLLTYPAEKITANHEGLRQLLQVQVLAATAVLAQTSFPC